MPDPDENLSDYLDEKYPKGMNKAALFNELDLMKNRVIRDLETNVNNILTNAFDELDKLRQGVE